ncbi:MAG: hypothetical protein LBV44_03425 [Methylobacillus sp.]|jgi:hypothetical protein|nr:hypothetical protein [Methylobacillus sp.]
MKKELMLSTATVMSDEATGDHHRDRWNVFNGGTDAIGDEVDAMVGQGEVLDTGLASKEDIDAVIASGEPKGTLLFCDGKEKGARTSGAIPIIRMNTGMTGGMVIFRTNKDGTAHKLEIECCSMYPIFGDGAEVEGVVENLSLFPDRLQARLTIEIASLKFLIFAYDPLFCLHRALYREGESYLFSASALAYSMRSAKGLEHVIDDPDEIRHFRAREAWYEKHGEWAPEDKAESLAAWQPQTPEDMEPIHFDMSQMTMLMPFTGAAPADDAEYSGEVVRVTPDAVNVFGTNFWRVDVTLLRSGEDVAGVRITNSHPFDFGTDKNMAVTIPIYVAENMFKGDWRPAVGEYVTGDLWLQAYVKGIPNKRKLITQDAEEYDPSWDSVEEALQETRGRFFSEIYNKKDCGKICVLESATSAPQDYIQTVSCGSESNEVWRLERREWHLDGSWTHYYARLVTDGADVDLIGNLDYVVAAFKAFYHGGQWPENLLWVEWDLLSSSGKYSTKRTAERRRLGFAINNEGSK